MLILFDHGTPKGLTRALIGHTIITAQARGWDKLNNSELLDAAEEAAVDLLLTTDRKSSTKEPCRIALGKSAVRGEAAVEHLVRQLMTGSKIVRIPPD